MLNDVLSNVPEGVILFTSKQKWQLDVDNHPVAFILQELSEDMATNIASGITFNSGP